MINCYEIRKSLGLTQKEMAEKLGVSHRAVQNYEAGRTPKSRIFEAYKKLQEDIMFDGSEAKQIINNYNESQQKINNYKLRIKQLEEENQKLRITIKYLSEIL